MKKRLFTSNILPARFRLFFIMVCNLFTSFLSFSQPTNFYNGGVDITIDPTTILYVDGHVINTVSGSIHNSGDIYLTGDWTNDNVPGGLDPNTGTVNLYGSSTQTIKGTATTTFNNLDCEVTGIKKLDIYTIVGGTAGVLSLQDSPFDLNSNTLEVTNSATSAITKNTPGGYIISETVPAVGYGKIQWDIGSSLSGSIYEYPFGTTTGDYIPFFYEVTTQGSVGGNITVATYPTDVTPIINNRPLPAGVSNLDYTPSLDASEVCADRFWIVDALNYSANPTADITFTYREEEWDPTIGGSTNTIIADSLLKGWMWDGTVWQSPTVGTCDPTANTVKVTGITGSDSVPWTLKAGDPPPFVCGKLDTPNAFSPNNDGHSDLFILKGWEYCVSSFSIVIFNRWGEKVFETDDVTQGWDGTYKGKALDPAVFVYYIKAKGLTDEKVNKKGNISLIR